jgi:hypothetical protein
LKAHETSVTDESVVPPADGAKDVAFYGAAVQAWIDTRMEFDRAIMTLSAGALGLIVTILTTVGILVRWQLIIYAIACLAFAGAIGMCLSVYRVNAAHIRATLGKEPGHSVTLKRMDKWALCFFLVGILAFAAAGLSNAFYRGTYDRQPQSSTEASGNDGRGTAQPRWAGRDSASQPPGDRRPSSPDQSAAERGDTSVRAGPRTHKPTS